MLGPDFREAYPPLQLEDLPEAQVMIDSLVLHGLSRPVFLDTYVGEAGLPHITNPGIYLHKKRNRPKQYWRDQWQAAIPDKISKLSYFDLKLKCIANCLTDRERQLVRLVFKGLESAVLNQKIESRLEKDEINDAAAEIRSPMLEIKNRRLFRMMESILEEYLVTVKRLEAEDQRSAVVKTLTQLMISEILEECRTRGFVSPHYQVPPLKFQRMRSRVSVLIAGQEQRLRQAYSDPESAQSKHDFSQANLELVNAVLDVLGIVRKDSDGGIGILVPLSEE